MGVIPIGGGKYRATVYSEPKYKAWQKAAAEALKRIDAPLAPLAGPLHVSINCVSERPKTTKLHAPKPDIDNYVKSVLDAITADGRFWVDDTQVTELYADKAWSSHGDPCGITVTITSKEP